MKPHNYYFAIVDGYPGGMQVYFVPKGRWDSKTREIPRALSAAELHGIFDALHNCPLSFYLLKGCCFMLSESFFEDHDIFSPVDIYEELSELGFATNGDLTMAAIKLNK